MSNIVRVDFTHGKKASGQTKSTDKQHPGFQLRLELVFSDPIIWRRIKVPGNLTLAKLHKIIQLTMGWTDSYSHQFLVGKIFYKTAPEQTDSSQSTEYNEAEVELWSLEESMSFIFTYIYDAGAGWECEITLEKILQPTEAPHPILLDGEQAGPPESIDDIHEYHDFLHALESRDKSISRQARIRYHIADDFDPSYCDIDGLHKILQRI